MSPDNLSVLDFSTTYCGEVLKVLLKNTVMRYRSDVLHLDTSKPAWLLALAKKGPLTYTYNSIKKIFIYKKVGKWV